LTGRQCCFYDELHVYAHLLTSFHQHLHYNHRSLNVSW
jgi:hypothetical protein